MMKKFLLLFLSFLFVGSIEAQFIKNFGIKFGVATTNQFTHPNIPEDIIDPVSIYLPNKNYVGISIGLSAEFLNYSPFSLVFEGNYIQKGSKEESIWYDETVHIYEQKIDYLSISLLLKTKMNLGIINPYLLVGPRLDMGINYEDSQTAKYYNNYIPGYVVGVGGEIPLNKIVLLAEITYDPNLRLLHDGYERMFYESFVFRLGILL